MRPGVGERRVVLIGIDGASYGMIAELAAAGTLPHLKRLIEGGTFRPMTSSLPEVSPVAWNSIITGANPATHGTFGFTDLAPHSYRTVFASAQTRAVSPFWARGDEGRSVVINMPFTYPAQPLDGVLIAGFVAPDLEKAIYPPSLVPELQSLDYRIDVDGSRAGQSLDLFLRDLDRTLQARIAVYRRLWQTEAWQTFVLVFTGTDRLSHFLWDACLDPDHPYHQPCLDHFRQVDATVGEIADRLWPDDLLVIVSDHGFEPLDQNVYVNAILRDFGLLGFETDAPRSLRDISSTASAFALEPSRIYVHTRDRYPKGSIAASEQEVVLRDLTQLFQELTFHGRPVIKRVFHRDEIYDGPLLHRAPDLVLWAERGFDLRGSPRATAHFGQHHVRGKHARDNAILLVHGMHDRSVIPDQPCVTDVVGIVDRIVKTTSPLT